MQQNIRKEIENEHVLMQMAGDHDNILKCVDLQFDSDFIKPSKNIKRKYHFIVMEIASGGTLFEYF